MSMTWMKPKESITLCEISHREKDKYQMISLIFNVHINKYKGMVRTLGYKTKIISQYGEEREAK